jgi:hypothetical protein
MDIVSERRKLIPQFVDRAVEESAFNRHAD